MLGLPFNDLAGMFAPLSSHLRGFSEEGNGAGGRLLVHDISQYQQCVDRGMQGRPRGWLSAFTPRGAPSAQTLHLATGSPHSADEGSSTAGSHIGGHIVSGSTSSRELAVSSPGAFDEVPVPTIFMGSLPAPISAGQATLDAEALLSNLRQGLLPSDSLPEADREVWRAASRITDSISAFNICQAQQLAGRKLILTERGVAEQLARGTIQMQPVSGGKATAQKVGGVLRLLNPLAPLNRLVRQLADGQRLSRQVQARAAALDGGKRSSNSAGAAAGPPAAPDQQAAGEVQYSLQQLPARRLLASGSPPQLAWVPLRVALQLLRSLPQHFVLLQGSAGQGERQQGKQRSGSGGGVLTAATSPAGLEVHIIPGLRVRQLAPDGSAIEFVPAFLCARQVQALWRDLREISGGGMLVYRRLERALMRRRLETAAAVIAGGFGARGVQAGSSMQDDEDGGGVEEPPEVADFMRELSGSLAHEAGTAMGGPGPSGLPRLAATFACGVVSLAAQGLSWAGNTADWLMMATPLGPRLLGVPEATITTCSLGEVLGGMQRYNRDQAVLSARLGHALADLQQQIKELREQVQQEGQQQDATAQGATAAASASSSTAAALGASGNMTDDTAAEASAGGRRQQEAEAAQQYSRALAAAAIWLALGTKSLAEDSGLAGLPLGRMLAKAVMQQQAAAAVLGGSVGHQLAGVQATATLPTPPDSPAADVDDTHKAAMERLLAEGLPLLEHNGFQHLLFQPTGSTQAATRGTGKKGSGAASTEPLPAMLDLARAIAQHCTSDTQIGLAAFVKDDASGSFSTISQSVGPLPCGRGLIIVGDLDLKPRQRGRTAARTTTRWLTVGVDDGRKLL